MKTSSGPSLPTKTLAAAAVVLGLTCVRGLALWGGVVIGIVTLSFLPWAIYSIVRMTMRPAERRSRAIRLAIWIGVLAIALSVRTHWDTAARAEATAVAAALQAHQARTGAYPASLSELGLDADALKKEFSLTYRVHEGQASLFYSRPSMPMIADHYNFEHKTWTSRD
ncbi:hypothetical protein [Pseudoduganella sp. OTU4001]|uniref:hypothetical protein n=1 Tax=Pseudoduganella sp. OTU4001 TaxID=3043854 RepID=UPI00313E15B8